MSATELAGADAPHGNAAALRPNGRRDARVSLGIRSHEPTAAVRRLNVATSDSTGTDNEAPAGGLEQPDTGTPKARTAGPRAIHALQGCIEEADWSGIKGWVWNPQTPKERIRLTLMERKTRLITTIADDYRPGLIFAGLGDGRHGFVIPLQNGLLSDGRHVLHLRSADTGEEVPGSPIVLEGRARADMADTGADVPAPPRVLGGRGQPDETDIGVKVQSLPSVLESRVRPDKATQTLVAGKVPLEAAVDGADQAPIGGQIDHADTDGIITGWCWSPLQPSARRMVEVLVDGIVAGTVLCDEWREDLLNAKIGDGAHAFRVIIPPENAPVRDGSVIALRDSATGAPLHEVIATPSLRPLGPEEQPTTIALRVPLSLEPHRELCVLASVHGQVTGIVCGASATVPPRVVIYADGRRAGVVTATGPIATLQEQDLPPVPPPGAHWFQFEWRAPNAQIESGLVLEIVPIRGGTEIVEATEVVRLRPHGRVSFASRVGLADDSSASGWIVDCRNPEKNMEINVYLDEHLIATLQADEPTTSRDSPVLRGLAKAFSFPIPQFSDGRERLLHFYEASTGFELGGSPLILQESPQMILSHLSFASPPFGRQQESQIRRSVHWFAQRLSETGAGDSGRLTNVLRSFDLMVNGRDLDLLSTLEFPQCDNPTVSIIIPAYNQVAFTWRCLNSVLVAGLGTSYEVILIDDCSTDATPLLEKRCKNLRYVRQTKNSHFIKSCNAGARLARGDYLYFLNNDAELAPDALDWLLRTFTIFPNAGVVGSKLVYPDGRLQEVGAVLWDDGEAWNVGRGGLSHAPEFNYARECHYVSGASLIISRALFEKVGGFDERFVPAYFEDSDLCMSVRKTGYAVLVQPKSTVLHWENVSAKSDPAKATSRLQRVNKPKFVQKWSSELARHPKQRDADLHTKDLGSVRRGLFFDWIMPRVDEDAGSFAALQEMRALSELGIKVTFASLEMEYVERYASVLESHGIECAYKPYYEDWRDFIIARGGEFDFVYGMRYEIMEQVIDFMKERMPHAKIIFNCADLHFLRESRELQLQRETEGLDPTAMAALQQKVLTTQSRELSVARRSHYTIVYNQVEQEMVTALVPEVPSGVMPWSVPVRDSGVPFASRNGIAFLGNYKHRPNIDAVRFFAQEVMPLLAQHRREVKFYIYGASPTPEVLDLASEQVEIVGWVPDVEEAYARHKVFVAPLR